MSTSQKLAEIAKTEAQRFFHGRVMKTEHNLHDIIGLFPKWHIDEADGMWCAGFVYYCCMKAGFVIPTKPKECTRSLAGCLQWEQWAIGDNGIGYFGADSSGFVPMAGDIVLFDNVFIDHEHDHIGVVVENKEASIIVAEGNINNVSGVIERDKDLHIRGFIRIPDGYVYGSTS